MTPVSGGDGSQDDDRPAVSDASSALSHLDLPGPILLIAPEPFYEDRGTPIAIREVLRALSENGREVHLLTFPMGRDIELPGLTVFRVPNLFGLRRVPIGFSLKKLILDQLMTGVLFWRLRSTRYACIHAVEEMGFPAVLAGRLAGVPVLWDMQSDMPDQLQQFSIFRSQSAQRLLRRCERWLIMKADAIVCSSGLESQVLRIRPDANVREWRFPSQFLEEESEIRLQRRSELGIGAAVPVILYTGNFEPYQGIPLLVEAANLVHQQRPDAVFVFVGAESPDEVPAGAEELVARGAVKIIARQPRKAIPGFLALADVVISPRSADGNIPLKVFDYMAAGKPIVATDIESHRTVLTEDRSILVEVSGRGLAEGLLRVLDDPDLSERLAVAARDYAAEHLTWLAFSQEVARLHQRLVFQDNANGRG